MKLHDYPRQEFVLGDYLDDLKSENIVFKTVGWSESSAALPVTQVSYDSRKLQEDTFFLCKGNKFKRQYLLDAIAQGTIAYLAERDLEVDIPGIIVSDMRRALTLCAQRYFEWPQRELSIMGITGTKGKSTTVTCLRAIFDEWLQRTGKAPAGFISSIEEFDGFTSEESVLTTPEPIELYTILRNCVTAGIEHVILESSSQGFKYGRLDDIEFSFASILNIAEDHISDIEHKDFDDYKAAKLALIDHSEKLVVNLDVDLKDLILEKATKQQVEVITLSMKEGVEADYRAENIRSTADGLLFDVRCKAVPDRDIKDLFVSLHGHFNTDNAMVAITIALESGADEASIRQALSEVAVSGRMMLFPTDDGALLGLVDYAHNKLSFEALFQWLHKDYPNHKYIAIFGSTGDKAVNRRRELGIAAGKYADLVYLTSDDVGYEPFDSINADIIPHLDSYEVPWTADPVRENCLREAFAKAVDLYRETGQQSVVLALGKGDESSVYRAGVYEPINSDLKVMKQLVGEYNASLKQGE
ncbi:MAG: UDP-N-acetylmuramyl-tripeptide synthetase [Eubacteriales bacterium]|nr:UDP-N-acetylmuramyl-tripeptide synthetase [Eubacteriales bacterium]MDD4324147.1 UDP-N-acetylmuramyl-tripeptide synthetase [Eubacteriales bacterium]MDD4540961.1 UDP-N-acetylmuramyl-tripeptide synthetase [Eubacteriales bacterium]